MKCNCIAEAILLDKWAVLREPEDWIYYKKLVNPDNDYEMDPENIPTKFPCLVKLRESYDSEGNGALTFYIVTREEAHNLFPERSLLDKGRVYDLRDVDINFKGEGVTMNEGQS